MIAVDTNLLVYAHRKDSTFHAAASDRMRHLAEGRSPWGIPWPCVHEFLAIVTHPRIFSPPTPVPLALSQVDAWIESPSLVLLAEAEAHWARLRFLMESGHAAGPKVHDARIAAICEQHGIRELWTADRDFGRFPRLNAVNPLVSRPGL
jgi:toxin-antitoxin system PIN domain toxin